MSLSELIKTITPKYNLKPEWVAAVIEIESGYRKSPNPRYEPHIKDWSFGYGQILSATAVWLANRIGSDQQAILHKALVDIDNKGLAPLVHTLEDPVLNIHLLCAYLQYQMNRYGNIYDAVAAYNSGSVRRTIDGSYVNQYHVDKFKKALRRIESYENLSDAIASFGDDNP